MPLFRKAPEPEPERLEDHLRLLVESSPEGMVICDAGDRVVFANPEFCRMFGWKHSEVIGTLINDLVANSDETRAEASSVSSSVISKPHILPDTLRAGKNGKNIPISLLAGPINNKDKVIGVYGIYRDISSMKNAETDVRREKAFFENLFANTPQPIALCNSDRLLIKANQAFTDLFGYTEDEMRGKELNLFVAADPELLKEALELDAEVWSSEKILTLDTWRTKKDGTRLPVKILEFPFRVDEETLLDYTMYFDRSSEIKADVAVSQEKALFEKLFRSCPDAITLENQDAVILKANDAFYRMFGYSESDEIIGKDVNTIVAQDPAIRQEAKGMDRRFWSGENIDQDVVRQRKDGSLIHLALTQTHFKLPDGTLVDYVIYHDIEDRIKAEQELRKSERRYAAIVEDQVEMVCRFLPEGETTFVNDAFCVFFGISREQILSNSLEEIIGGENAEALSAGNENLKPDCHNIFHEHLCHLPSGKKRWLRWSKRGIFDENGSLVEIQAVGRDTTEIKHTEQTLRHLNNVIRSIRGVNRLINRHHNKERLIQEICTHLIETRGYRNVWIGILGNGGKLISISEVGIGPDGRPLSERIKHESLNEWGLSILENKGVSLKHGVITMTDCPLLDHYEEAGIMATRLEYSGKVYGLISVSIPSTLPADMEEQELFRELAEDISFALHTIEIENDREEKSSILERKACQLELLVRNHSDGLWEWNVSDGRIDLSPNYELMLGYTPGEVNRSFEGWQSLIHPEDLKDAAAALEEVVSGQGGKNLYEASYRMRTKEGGWKKIIDRGYAVRRDRFGRASHMVGTHVLLTETPAKAIENAHEAD